MSNVVFVFAAMVIVSLQCTVYANLDNKVEIDNSLQANAIPAQRRLFKNHVGINVSPPETVEHHGSPIKLECQAFGAPAPTFIWLKNGEPVSDSEEDSNEIDVYSVHASSVAQVISRLVVTQPANGDVYTCVATAGPLQDSASTTVYIADDFEDSNIEKLIRLPLKPVITSSYQDLMQRSGSNLVLPCRVTSFTKYQQEWIDSNGKIVYGNGRIRVLPSGDLLIMGLRWTDTGRFICNVKNAFGKDRAETFLYVFQ